MTAPISGKRLAIGVLIASNLAIWAYCARRNFATVEEVRQVAAGVAHWRTGNFAAAGDSPPLGRMLAALPLLVAAPGEWSLGYIDKPISMNRDAELRIGASYAYENADDYAGLLFLARASSLAWWLLGAWLIVRWSGELCGPTAGIMVLALWCFEPNVMAGEQAATPDLAAAVSMLAATYTFWRYLRGPSWPGAMAAGALLGLALLVAFEALALLLAWPVLALIDHLARRGDAGRAQPLLARIRDIGIGIFAALWVVNAGYGWSGTGTPLGELAFAGRVLGGEHRSASPFHDNAPVGNRFVGSRVGELPIPVPADYLLGLDRRCRESASGDVSPSDGGQRGRGDGVLDPAAIAFRIPIGLLALGLGSAMLALFRRPGAASLGDGATLWLPVAAILMATMLPIGAPPRPSGILVLLPFGILAAGKFAPRPGPGRWWANGLALALALWAVGGGLASLPQPHAYLNELVAGPRREAARLHYGGADCGPDLSRLAEWLRGHPEVRHLNLALDHPADPLAYGVQRSVDPRPCGLRQPAPPPGPVPTFVDVASFPETGPLPGYYAVDLHHLDGPHRFLAGADRIASIGRTIAVYHLSEHEAGEFRDRMGFPPLAPPAKGSGPAGGPEAEGAFQFRTLEGPDGRSTHYAVFVPRGYAADRPHPLIFFLHGVGDSGTQGRQYLNVGLPRIVEKWGDSFGFLVACPQGPTGFWTAESEDTQRAMAILDAVAGEWNVDRDRIALTGLSSGGGGVWNLAARYPDRWSALVPISSGMSDASLAGAIKHIPTWCFHNCNDYGRLYRNCDDMGCPPEGPRAMIRALVDAGGAPRYTEFLHIGDTHNAWDRAYTSPALYDWLARQRRPSPSTAPEQLSPKPR